MSEIIIAIIAASATLIVALLSLWGAKKYNIGPNQEKLVVTLKDLVAAQQIRIEQLETIALENGKQINDLRVEVDRLTRLTITQALKISELERIKGG